MKLNFLSVCCFFCFSTLFAQKHKDSLTAEKIINNAIIAMGGKEYLQTIKTLYLDVAVEMDGRQNNWITKKMQPNKESFEISWNNEPVYRSWFDGKKAFETERGKKRKLNPAKYKVKISEKYIFNELNYLDRAVCKLALAGDATVNGEDCYKVKVTRKNGDVSVLYFSKTSFYQVRIDKMPGAARDSIESTFLGAYSKFGELTMYTEMKFEYKGVMRTARVVKLLINEMVSEADFK